MPHGTRKGSGYNTVFQKSSVKLSGYAAYGITGTGRNIFHRNPLYYTAGDNSCQASCLIGVIFNYKIFDFYILHFCISNLIGQSTFLGILSQTGSFDGQIRYGSAVYLFKQHSLQSCNSMSVSVQFPGKGSFHRKLL